MTAPRALVVGSTFGRHYARALAAPDSQVRLAAVMGTGNPRGRALAEELGVPYVRDGDAVKVDLAVVAVRSAVVGGPGDEIARTLLDRGVAVLQELPVHSRELADSARAARRRKVSFGVNTFYEHLRPVRLLQAVTTSLRESGHELRSVDLRTSVQVLHCALHVVGSILNCAPSGQHAVHDLNGPGRLLVDSVWGAVPVTLLVHNRVDPADPNNNCQPLLDMVLTYDIGEVHLAAPHGPLRWTRRLHEHAGEFHLPEEPISSMIEGAGTGTAIEDLWHDGIRHAVGRFAAGELTLGQRHLAIGRWWERLSAEMRLPVPVPVPPPAPPSFDILRGLDGRFPR